MMSGGFDHAILFEYTRGNGWSPREDFNTINNLAVENPGGVYRVALSDGGIRVAIGSPNNAAQGINSGVVQVFEPGPDGNYKQIGRTLLSTAVGDHFGRALDLTGDGAKIIIGAYGGNYAKTFIYSNDTKTWDHEVMLSGAAGDAFGFSVAISGDGNEAIIGAPFANANVGFARVFDLETNANIQTFRGSFGNDEFGMAVDMSLDGLSAIVGAPGGNYVQCLAINPLTGLWGTKGTNLIDTEDSGYGSSVSISGDGTIIAIGAPLKGEFDTDIGLSRTFEFSTVTDNWIQLGNDLMGQDKQHECGTAVVIASSGQRHAIGCPGSDGAGFETGRVCVATKPITGDDDDFIFPSFVPTMSPSLSGIPSTSPIESLMPSQFPTPFAINPSNPSVGFAEDDGYVTLVGQPLVINAPGILANDNPGLSDVLSVQSCSVPSKGSVSFDSQGGFIYTPSSSFIGVAFFTCTVSNGRGGLDTSQVIIGIALAPSDPPSIAPNPSIPFTTDDIYTTDVGQFFVVNNPGILANDNSGPNDVLSVQSCIQPSTGTLFYNGQGGFSFIPPSTFTGIVTFECTISNGNGGLDTSEVIIGVIPMPSIPSTPSITSTPSTPSSPSIPSTPSTPSTPPTPSTPSTPFTPSTPTVLSTPTIGFAVDDNYTIPPGQSLIVNAPGILANDNPGPNDILSVQSCSSSINGGLTFNSQGGFTFTPLATFVGVTSFTCIISNGNEGSDSSQVIIGVMPTPSIPSNPSSPLTSSIPSNPPSPSNTSTPPSPTSPSTPFNSSKPSTGFTSFDFFTTPSGQILSINAPGILANDNPGPNGVLRVESCSAPNEGTLASFNAQGGFLYIPPAGFAGLAFFTCTISKGNSGFDNNQIVIEIMSPPTTFYVPSISLAPTPEGSTNAPGGAGGLAEDSLFSWFFVLFNGVSNLFQLFASFLGFGGLWGWLA